MSSEKNRICLVIPSLGPGGMERVMSILANYFDKNKQAEVHIILYGRKREVFYSISETIVVHKPGFVFDNSRRTWYTIKTLYFLRSCIKSINPDTMLSFGELWNNLFLLSSLGLNIPKFIADRAEPGLQKNWFQHLLCKWLYPLANGIIVQTEIAKEIYEKKYNQTEISVIGNPIRDLDKKLEVKKENAILSVGRLVSTKHFDKLIKIFGRINAPNWKLYIVGGDSQKECGMEHLKDLIGELDLEEKVVLTGTVSNVEKYYRKSKIFAFTSSSEGFPNVIGEAMASGLPVVAFDCIAGPSELIEDGENGFLIPLFDEDSFEKKLRILINNEELRKKMGYHSKMKIEEFSVEAIGEKFYLLITRNS